MDLQTAQKSSVLSYILVLFITTTNYANKHTQSVTGGQYSERHYKLNACMYTSVVLLMISKISLYGSTLLITQRHCVTFLAPMFIVHVTKMTECT
jgi:hypothetical protein